MVSQYNELGKTMVNWYNELVIIGYYQILITL